MPRSARAGTASRCRSSARPEPAACVDRAGGDRIEFLPFLGCRADRASVVLRVPGGGLDTIGIAVIGTGDWGANLVRNFASLPGARLAAVCDADPKRLAATAARHRDARACAHMDEVAASADVQGVVV